VLLIIRNMDHPQRPVVSLRALRATTRNPTTRRNATFIITMGVQQLSSQISIPLTLEGSLLASQRLQFPSSLSSTMLLEPSMRVEGHLQPQVVSLSSIMPSSPPSALLISEVLPSYVANEGVLQLSQSEMNK
jgi:hypothetical protein